MMRTRRTIPLGTMTSGELYRRAIKQKLECGHHESDLYLKCTSEARELVDAYKFRANVTTFTNQIDRQPWYDIPFAYQPFWDKAARRG